MRRNLIQVFNDTGAGVTSLLQLLHSLLASTPTTFTVLQTNGSLLQSSENQLNQTALLIFGGGYDLGYLGALGDQGCARIRQYIEDGGRYLGLCAGAYFASDRCVFDRNGPLEVVGPRFIKLFEGDAVGPYFPGYVYNSENGSWAAFVKSSRDDLRPSSALIYYNGGCTFKTTQWNRSKVLYTYANTSDPAIIKSNLGHGWGILSGVHFEYDPKLLNSSDPNEQGQLVRKQLLSNDEDRKRLWNAMLNELLEGNSSPSSVAFSMAMFWSILLNCANIF